MMPGVSRVPDRDLCSLETMSGAEQGVKTKASKSNLSDFQISGLPAQQPKLCNGLLSKSCLKNVVRGAKSNATVL